MRGNALAAVEDFDRTRRDTRPDLLAQQLVRHRVVVLVDLDVIIEPDPAFLPRGEDIGSVGNGLSADRSRSSNRARRLAPRWRDARILICATSSAMAVFNALSERNCRLRSLAMMKLVAI